MTPRGWSRRGRGIRTGRSDMQDQDTSVEARTFADRVKVNLTVRTSRTGEPRWDALWRDSNKKSKMKRVGPAWVKRRPALKNPWIDGAPGRTTENEPEIQESWRERWEAKNTTGKGSQAMRDAGAFDPNGAMARARDLVYEHELELARKKAEREQREREASPAYQAELAKRQELWTRTFAKVAGEWFSEASVTSGWKPTVVRDYAALLASPLDVPRARAGRPKAILMRAIGNNPIALISTPEVRALLTDIARATSARTANKHRTVLMMIFDFAVREGYCEDNPTASIKPTKIKKVKDLVVLDLEQVEAVSRAADRDLADIIRFAAYTGLRMGEIIALRWKDIRWTQRAINVTESFSGGLEVVEPKSGEARIVPMGDQVQTLLTKRSQRDADHAKGDLVFPNAAGDFMDPSTLRREYERARDEVRKSDADIPAATFHQLRHTFGTQCAKNSIAILSIQRWMGHADINTTMRYLSWAPQDGDAERISSALSFLPIDAPEQSYSPLTATPT